MKRVIIAGVAILFVAAVLWFFRSERTLHMSTGSMLPTIAQGARLRVDYRPLSRSQLQRFDIVAMIWPGRDPKRQIFRRIVGLPGESVELGAGTVTIDGTLLRTPNGLALGRFSTNSVVDTVSFAKIPPNHFFVMGDNTAHAVDSRFFGPVPFDLIIGKVVGFEHQP